MFLANLKNKLILVNFVNVTDSMHSGVPKRKRIKRKYAAITLALIVVVSLLAVLYVLNSAFSIEWTKNLSGSQSNSVIQTSDGGFLVAGQGTFWNETSNTNSDSAGLLIKTDSTGNIQWTKKYWVADYPTIFQVVIPTVDGGYAVGGICIVVNPIPIGSIEFNMDTEQFCLVKVDSEGNLHGQEFIKEDQKTMSTT